MPGYLEDLCPTEPALMADLLRMFLMDAAASVDKLSKQATAADAVAAARTLHTLKGSCSQMGGQHMERILEEMEERLREVGIETTRELLPALKVAFQELREAIENRMFTAADDPPRG